MAKRAPARRRPRKARPGTKGLGPVECRLEEPTGVREVTTWLRNAEENVLSLYWLGNRPRR
jgi:hypothetical protein